MNFRRLPLLLPIICATAFAACSDEDSTLSATSDAGVDAQETDSAVAKDEDAAPGADDAALTVEPVELQFEARVGAETFACGKTFTGLGTSNAGATAGDMRFFVHDVKLMRGTTEVPLTLDVRDVWQSARLGLLDFEDNTAECEFGTPGTNAKLTGTALGKAFDGISFTIGVPEDLNHLNKDTQAAPLVGSGLNWDWTTGYIHFAAQLNPTTVLDGGRPPSFFSHIGSTVCSGDPADGGTPGCAHKNRPRVTLTGFDPATKKIVVDLKKLFATSDLNVNAGGIPGCMSGTTDPECPPLFTALGLDFATGEATPIGGIFSAEAK